LHALRSLYKEIHKEANLEEMASLVRKFIKSSHCQSSLLAAISGEWDKRGKKPEALAIIEEIQQNARNGDEVDRVLILTVLMVELFNQKREQEADKLMREVLSYIVELKDDFYKDTYLWIISIGLSECGNVEKALECARNIQSKDKKIITSLFAVNAELVKKGRMEEAESVMNEAALICATEKKLADELFKFIPLGYAEQGNWVLAEKTAYDISRIANRQSCWKELAYSMLAQLEGPKAFNGFRYFQTEEARLFYLKGWAEGVKAADLDAASIRQALPLLSSDPESIEILLQKYALQVVFFDKISEEKTKRLNRTLRIQWAIDLKNSIHAN
jgi:hypothetical protein